MIVTPIDMQMDLLKSDLVRSPGLHASEIFGNLFKVLEPKRYDYGDAPPNAPLMALGTAWEKHFEYLLIANGVDAHRPDELMSPEGIAYSPDLLVFNGVTRVGEIKLTSMGLDDISLYIQNNLPPKFDKFDCQMKLYSHWLGLQHGFLPVMSIRRPYAPELRCFNIEWTIRELQENHTMCMNFAYQTGLLK